MEWYYIENGAQAGPISEEQFQGLVDSGQITAETMVWHAGLADWQTYGTVAEQAIVQPAPEPVPAAQPTVESAAAEQPVLEPGRGICCECGLQFSLNEMVRYENSTVCAACKPLFFQRLQEGAGMPGVQNLAGFWIRFGAWLIDQFIINAVNMIFSLISTAIAGSLTPDQGAMFWGVNGTLWVVQILFSGTYTTFFLGKFGATPGKLACKLRVVRPDGAKITYSRALGRYGAELLSGLICSIGYLMAAFDDERRTLHDRICDTRVVKAE